jgi:predicted nuclease of predicted toxin-antitoxin system
MAKYLIDENLPPIYQTQLRRRKSDLTVWVIGDPGTPPKGTLDPAILDWCEQHDFILITNNRQSMPTHLSDRLQHGQHIPSLSL